MVTKIVIENSYRFTRDNGCNMIPKHHQKQPVDTEGSHARTRKTI
jgi:hypothetical protein